MASAVPSSFKKWLKTRNTRIESDRKKRKSTKSDLDRYNEAQDFLTGKTDTSNLTQLEKAKLGRESRNYMNTYITPNVSDLNTISKSSKPSDDYISASNATFANLKPRDDYISASNATFANLKPRDVSSGSSVNKPNNTFNKKLSSGVPDSVSNINKKEESGATANTADSKLMERLASLSRQLEEEKKKNAQVPEQYQYNVDMGRIDQTLGNIDKAMQGYQNTYQNYDPNKDPVFNELANRTTSQMLQKFGARGLGGADFAQGAMSKANLQLGLDFKNQAMQNDLTNLQNYRNQLADLTGLEQQNYNRYRNAVGDYNTSMNNAINMEQTQYNRGLDTRNMQIEDYGFPLTPQTQQLVQTYQNLPPDVINQYRQYEGNYAARMNQLDPNSQEYQVLNAMRFNKIVSLLPQDPETYGKYLIQDYGIAPAQVQQMVANTQANIADQQLAQAKVTTEQFKAYIEQIKAQYADSMAQAELDKILAQVDKANMDALMAQIEAANLPQQIKQDLALTAARIADVKADTKLTNTKQQQELSGLTDQAQVIWGEYLTELKKNPNLDLNTFMNMPVPYEIGLPAGTEGPQQQKGGRYIDYLTPGEWEAINDYAAKQGAYKSDSSNPLESLVRLQELELERERMKMQGNQ